MTAHAFIFVSLLCCISIASSIRLPVPSRSVRTIVAYHGDGTDEDSGVADIAAAGASPISTFSKGISKNIKRLFLGGKSLIPSLLEAQKLKKVRKEKGDKGLTFLQYKSIEKAKEDMSKFLRLAITVPLSPEFFFYSYIVFPMMSPNNPHAWASLPSTFDDKEDKVIREKAMGKKRLQALISSISALKNECLDDFSPTARSQRLKQIASIEDALKGKSFKESLAFLEPWLRSDKKSSKKLSLNLSMVPGSVIKDCCRAVGIEGVPNIPLIRRMNVGELSKHIDTVRESDEFINNVGVESLREKELKIACHDRCISVDSRRNVKELREDLRKWVSIACEPVYINVAGSVSAPVVNEQNRRLALMSLFVASDAKRSKFASTYRYIMQ